jgi:hypothetical protein
VGRPRPLSGRVGLDRLRLARLGRLLALAALWMVGLSARGWAAEATLVWISGPPRSGEDTTVQVMVHELDRLVGGVPPVLRFGAGELVSGPVELTPGLWSVQLRAPSEPGLLQVEVAVSDRRRSETFEVAPPRRSPLTVDVVEEVPIGQGRPWLLRVLSPGGVRPEDLQIEPSEGALQSVQETVGPNGEAGALLSWVPSGDPFPRVALLALRDRRHPRDTPAWVALSLRGRPRVPVSTLPGAEVTLKIGSRSYGPVVAGPDGVATLNMEVRPGEVLAEVFVTDGSGNTQHSSLSLGGDAHPVLATVGSEAGPGVGERPTVFVSATRPDGRPWRESAPACRTSLGEEGVVRPDGVGQWRVSFGAPAQDAIFDIRVDCSLGSDAHSSVRIPVSRDVPARIVLRAFPTELSADAPLAQVEAHLENGAGDRLPASGLRLAADLGKIGYSPERGSLDGSVQGAYAGDEAIHQGADRLRATWDRPAGSGEPDRVRLSGHWTSGEGPVFAARVLDARGLPLAGVPVRLLLRGEAEDAATVASTDTRGWATFTIPSTRLPAVAPQGTERAPVIGVARVDDEEAQLGLLPGLQLGARPEDPDLSTALPITIRTGRVRSVFLSTEPRAVVGGGGASARVIVRLIDATGHPVSAEGLSLQATDGTLSSPRELGAGTYEATFTPSGRMISGTVRLTVSSAEARFADTSTEIEVLPPTVQWAPGLSSGAIFGGGGSTAIFGVSGDLLLPRIPGRWYGRIWGSWFRRVAFDEDELSGDAVRASIDVVPLGVGVYSRQPWARLTTWFGGGPVLVPYRSEVTIGSQDSSRGPGLSGPGWSASAGVGWRVRRSEIDLELTFLGLSISGEGSGWSGRVGGFAPTLGYRLLY